MIEKVKVARKEKQKKLHGFSLYQNIANFEAFLWNLKLSANRLFWRCALSLFFVLVCFFLCQQHSLKKHVLTMSAF